jgi:Family of unknown function (DUF6223)
MHVNEATLVDPVAAPLVAMSAGRLGAFVAVTLALAGLVIAGLALVRSRGRTGRAGGTGAPDRPDPAVVATVLGLTGTALGALIAATSDGGVGSGNGLGGAIVGLVLGLLATLLGGLARARSRRASTGRAPTGDVA